MVFLTAWTVLMSASVQVSLSVSLCIHVYTCVHVHACMYACSIYITVCICMYVCMLVCIMYMHSRMHARMSWLWYICFVHPIWRCTNGWQVLLVVWEGPGWVGSQWAHPLGSLGRAHPHQQHRAVLCRGPWLPSHKDSRQKPGPTYVLYTSVDQYYHYWLSWLLIISYQ